MQEKMLLSVSTDQNNNTAASVPLTGDHVVGGDDGWIFSAGSTGSLT